MDQENRDKQATEKKLSDQFAEFIDLTDEDLEEVDVTELGDVHGGQCGGCCGPHCCGGCCGPRCCGGCCGPHCCGGCGGPHCCGGCGGGKQCGGCKKGGK